MNVTEILDECIDKVKEYTFKKGIYPNTIFLPRDMYDIVKSNKAISYVYQPANETKDLKDKLYGNEVIVTLGNSIKVGYVI